MALLLNAQRLSKSYGAAPLFEDLSLSITDGDRLGFIDADLSLPIEGLDGMMARFDAGADAVIASPMAIGWG